MPVHSHAVRVLMLSSAVSLAACAAMPASGQGSTSPRPAAQCTESAVTDTLSPVWQGIWAQYGRIDEAVRRKYTTTLRSIIAPDYHAVLPNGEVWTHERTVAYQLNGLMSVHQVHHQSNTIIELTACDDHATATVLQQFYRTQRLAPDGPLYRLETNAVQDEHWTRFDDGWKRGRVDNIHGGAVFVDGKRANIGVGLPPYDPKAPPYDPHAPRP